MLSEQQQDTGANGSTKQPVIEPGLTPTQKKQWADTMSMMAWKAPGFRHIWFKMLNAQHNTLSDYTAIMTRDVPIAATDGRNILLNPDTFFKAGLSERVFVCCHEVVHNVYGDVELLARCHATGQVLMHDGSYLPFDEPEMQKAMDARINALLIESKMGKMLSELDGQPCGHLDPAVKGSDSVLDVYKKYYKKKFEDPNEEEPKPNPNGGNPGGFDVLQKPGRATGKPHHRDPGAWQVAINAAQHIENLRTPGKMSGALQRMFKQILEPEVPWVDHIETLISRVVGDGGYDWTQPHPWIGSTDDGDDYFTPASTGQGAGWIVIWGDTSGSRDEKAIASDVAELAGIMEAVNPQRLTVLWGDAEVAHIDEIADPADLAGVSPKGGGGTDYKPVLDWIAGNADGLPDLFIGFTDGYVAHPKRELPYPVIWACDTDEKFPFGTVVRRTAHKRDRGVI